MQKIVQLLDPRNTTMRWVPVLLLFLSLVGPSRGQVIDAQSQGGKPEFLIPLCMIVGAHAREIADESEDVKNQILKEFGIDAADWSVLSHVCQTLFSGVGELAREARAAQSRAGSARLDSASVADYNRRRQALLTQSQSNLQRSLSVPGWRALSSLMNELQANTTGVRIP